MMADPHSLIEGVIISAFAIRSHFAVIYVRGEAVHAHRRLMAAVEEAYAAGYLGTDILGSGYDLELVVHAGAGAYICGEETALLDSLEGYRGQPRLKPPFPAVAGLYGAPTVINNVETLASVPFVVRGGADWFKDFGPEKSPGPKIYSLSGRVVRPGQYEAPMGTTMRELLEMAGGIRPGHELKFWTPGGSSTPYFTAEHLDVPLDFDSVAAAGSMLGTTALMVFDETDSIVEATLRFTEFYAHESCGKCTPCREGTYWLVQILERIAHGRGTAQDLDVLLDTCDNILGRSFCALGDGATSCITSSLKYFKDDYVALLPPEEQARLGRTLRIEPVGACIVTLTTPWPGARAVPPGCARPAHPAGRRPLHDRRLRGRRAQGDADHPGRRADRRPDPAVLRPPAARAGRRLPPVPGRGRGPAQAGRLLHDAGHRGHGRADPAHQPAGGQGAAGHDGAAADQPPAGLPGLRQGRRVPAAEPGDEQRPHREPVRRRQAHLSRSRCRSAARSCSTASAACSAPAAPASPSRWPATRSSSCSSAGALEQVAIYEDEPFESLLLRQHHPDLPGRRAHQRAVPLPRPPVRPAQRAERLRALRVRLRPAHRLPPRQGHPPAGRRGPGGQRGVELRQGPLRVPLRHLQPAADHAAGARSRRRAAARVLARGLGRRGGRPARRA